MDGAKFVDDGKFDGKFVDGGKIDIEFVDGGKLVDDGKCDRKDVLADVALHPGQL